MTEAGVRVRGAMIDALNGRETRCEVLGEVEIAISRIGQSV